MPSVLSTMRTKLMGDDVIVDFGPDFGLGVLVDSSELGHGSRAIALSAARMLPLLASCWFVIAHGPMEGRRITCHRYQLLLNTNALGQSARCCGGCHRVQIKGVGVDTPGYVRFKYCSGCRRAYYCTRACQTAHWPIHAAACRLARKRADEACC
jgi:hypothetical protein